MYLCSHDRGRNTDIFVLKNRGYVSLFHFSAFFLHFWNHSFPKNYYCIKFKSSILIFKILKYTIYYKKKDLTQHIFIWKKSTIRNVPSENKTCHSSILQYIFQKTLNVIILGRSKCQQLLFSSRKWFWVRETHYLFAITYLYMHLYMWNTCALLLCQLVARQIQVKSVRKIWNFCCLFYF